jgi:hypothetical protein
MVPARNSYPSACVEDGRPSGLILPCRREEGREIHRGGPDSFWTNCPPPRGISGTKCGPPGTSWANPVAFACVEGAREASGAEGGARAAVQGAALAPGLHRDHAGPVVQPVALAHCAETAEAGG